MDLNLAGKAAVVTGASKGIGLAVTQALAGEGASLTAGARDGSDELAKLADAYPVRPVLVDLSTPQGPGPTCRRGCLGVRRPGHTRQTMSAPCARVSADSCR